MKDIERFEKLTGDIEKLIPTSEFIKEQTNIDVISIKKYFPQAYRAKRIIITGVYVIFTTSKDRYIGSSRNVLNHINLYKTENLLVAYIYETKSIDTKSLELYLYKLLLDQENIIPKKIEDIVYNNSPKNICMADIIPKNIDIIRCIDNITIDDIRNIHHVPGTYILQFTNGEYYIGSSTNLRIRLMQHKSNLFSFIYNISICETQNIIDALILEGIFIKLLEPKYNCIRRLDNGIQSINMLKKGSNLPYKNIQFRNTNMQFIALSKDISELLEKKMIELFNQGIFSLSTQKLAELAIREGLGIIFDNISQIIYEDMIYKNI